MASIALETAGVSNFQPPNTQGAPTQNPLICRNTRYRDNPQKTHYSLLLKIIFFYIDQIPV
ncbi:hypothetical protein [Porticoccus sp.]